MMQVTKKWMITIWSIDIQLVQFKIHENHYSNVLNQLAKLDFGELVTHIDISEIK